ncbi:MAG: type II toxin-antitoxin system VapC family toxin [Dehalococcoidia bacterium]
MIIYYLDASAWVKRYVREPGSDWIQDLFVQQPLLACASLGYVEVMATLSRKSRAGELGRTQFDGSVEELDRDWAGFIEVRLDTDTLALATGAVRRYALRGADAVHLASALLLRQHLTNRDDEVWLVAADEELKSAAQASGLTVLDPAEQEAPAQQSAGESE